MSKPKSNSVMDSLPQNQRDQVEAWLFEENISYKDAVKRLKEDFNVSIAPSSLSEWRQRRERERRKFEALHLIAESRSDAQSIRDQFDKHPADTYSAFLDFIQQLAFDASMKGEKLDLKEVSDLGNLVLSGRSLELKEREMKLKERRMVLLEKKAAAFDKAKEEINTSGGLTAETLKKIESELKLL